MGQAGHWRAGEAEMAWAGESTFPSTPQPLLTCSLAAVTLRHSAASYGARIPQPSPLISGGYHWPSSKPCINGINVIVLSVMSEFKAN